MTLDPRGFCDRVGAKTPRGRRSKRRTDASPVASGRDDQGVFRLRCISLEESCSQDCPTIDIRETSRCPRRRCSCARVDLASGGVWRRSRGARSDVTTCDRAPHGCDNMDNGLVAAWMTVDTRCDLSTLSVSVACASKPRALGDISPLASARSVVTSGQPPRGARLASWHLMILGSAAVGACG